MFESLTRAEAVKLHEILTDHYGRAHAVGTRATMCARTARTQYGRDMYNGLANDMAALRTEINIVRNALVADGPYTVVS